MDSPEGLLPRDFRKLSVNWNHGVATPAPGEWMEYTDGELKDV